jgi:hypothetical protein
MSMAKESPRDCRGVPDSDVVDSAVRITCYNCNATRSFTKPGWYADDGWVAANISLPSQHLGWAYLCPVCAEKARAARAAADLVRLTDRLQFKGINNGKEW